MPLTIALSAAAVLLAISAVATRVSRTGFGRPLVYGLSAVLCGLNLALALAHLLSGAAPVQMVLPIGLPMIGAHFSLDLLAAFFLFVVNLGGLAASVYALGYGRHESAPQRVLPFYPAFLAAMTLVVLAADAFTFLVGWELMSLMSWALVLSQHRVSENTRAGYVYLVMANFGTATLLLAFGLLAGSVGGYTFEMIRSAPPGPAFAAGVLALTLLGAGSKAGLVPVHAWLPLAHPAAPSHVSALMSGVMTKVAVYGFVRIVFDLMGGIAGSTDAWWWSVAVLLLGGATAAMGVLYALMQRDLKRLLAYSTVENIGVIFIALGLALAFRANGMGAAAALAMTAGLFHIFNHALFKSLLFFAAGAVLHATGLRDLEKLGGLIHRMPATAVAALIGAAAIAALPPLNGFASEWLIFQAVLLSPALPQWALKFLVPAIAATLALTAALVAACFVRAYGIIFLGRPRSEAATGAHETDRFSAAAMAVMAAGCVAAGVLPGPVLDALGPTVAALTGGGRLPLQTADPWLTVAPVSAARSSYNGLLVLAFIAASATVTALIVRRIASKAVRRGPAWDCGFPVPDPATQYSADSFAQPLRRVFGSLAFRLNEQVDMPAPGDARPAQFRLQAQDLIWTRLYEPIADVVRTASERINALQFLTVRQYLSLVFATLVFLMTMLALWT